jgi:hypothetical protein
MVADVVSSAPRAEFSEVIVLNVLTSRSQAYSRFIRIALLQSEVPAKIAPNPTKLEC